MQKNYRSRQRTNSKKKTRGQKSFAYQSDRKAAGRDQGGRRRQSFKGKSNRGRTKAINIEHFISQAKETTQKAEHVIKHTFADFGFTTLLQKNLQFLKYTTPTAIQDQTIPLILEQKDVVGLANTGTGKTGAFLLPLLHHMSQHTVKKVLVIAPTRELAVQIDEEFKKYAHSMNIYSAVCIGGMPITKQLNRLKRNPHVIIGTPGRLDDLSKRKALRFDVFDVVVLDEVDRMLDMGFVDIIKSILKDSRTDRQSLFFSATMSQSINVLIQQFSNNLVIIETSMGKTAPNVHQGVIRVQDDSMKLDQLVALLNKPEFKKVLVFSETKRQVEALTQSLYSIGFKVDSIHGNKRQRQRDKSLANFKKGAISVLVATDVAARGLDIQGVSHVINYTLPQTYDDYIHRIGRTGRGSQKGNAVTFV